MTDDNGHSNWRCKEADDNGHKNLVKFHDAFEDADNVYIVMEYVQIQNLRKVAFNADKILVTYLFSCWFNVFLFSPDCVMEKNYLIEFSRGKIEGYASFALTAPFFPIDNFLAEVCF